MKKWNGIVLYFLIIIHICYCSIALKNFNVLETNTELESKNFFTNEFLSKLCSSRKEGRISLISFDSNKKLMANPIYIYLDSENYNLYNLNKKSIITTFKTKDLESINKIPVFRKVPKIQNKNCFELLFLNEKNKNPDIRLRYIPITLCASSEDEKLDYLKKIVDSKQCELNIRDKKIEGIDRTKVYKNINVVQKLVKERNKRLEKLIDPYNLNLKTNATDLENMRRLRQKLLDEKKRQKGDDEDIYLKRILKFLKNLKFLNINLFDPRDPNYLNYIKKIRKSRYNLKKVILMERIMTLRVAVLTKFIQDKIKSKKKVVEKDFDDDKDKDSDKDKDKDKEKDKDKKKLKDIFNDVERLNFIKFILRVSKRKAENLDKYYINLVDDEKDRALQENLKLIDSLKKIEQAKKGVYKMCLLTNTPESKIGDYLKKKKDVCVIIYGFDNPNKVNECMNNDQEFCKDCCRRFAKNEKITTCLQSCKEYIKRAKSEYEFLNSLKLPSKEEFDKKRDAEKKKKNNLVNNLLKTFNENEKNKIKDKNKKKPKRDPGQEEIDKLINESEEEKRRKAKKTSKKKKKNVADDLLNIYKENRDLQRQREKKQRDKRNSQLKKTNLIDDLFNRIKPKKKTKPKKKPVDTLKDLLEKIDKDDDENEKAKRARAKAKSDSDKMKNRNDIINSMLNIYNQSEMDKTERQRKLDEENLKKRRNKIIEDLEKDESDSKSDSKKEKKSKKSNL